MKQTVEEAARVYAKRLYPLVQGMNYVNAIDAFKAGAKWQAKQSPWISVEEQLPEENQEYLVVLNSGVICVARYNKNNKSWLIYGAGYTYKVVAYMSIPTFDQILEANKDVLQRIKDK